MDKMQRRRISLNTMKNRLPLIISGIAAVLVFLLVGFFVGAGKTSEYQWELLDRLSANPMNIDAVEYDMLDLKYRLAVSRSEYEAADTNEEILEIYRKFNEVHYEEKSLFDGWKCPDASGFIDADGKKYAVTVNISLSTRLFGTDVTNFCADITEYFQCSECERWLCNIDENGKCVICAGLTGYVPYEER